MTEPTEDQNMIRALFADAIDAPPAAPATSTPSDDNSDEVDRKFAAKLFGRDE